MRPHLLSAFLAISVAACATSSAGVSADWKPDPGVTDIVGRNAAIAMSENLQVQRLIRQGKTQEALEVLDAGLSLELIMMLNADPVMPKGDRYFDLRDRDLRQLKQHWLEHRPMYVHEDMLAYIEAACTRMGDCAKGTIAPSLTSEQVREQVEQGVCCALPETEDR